MSITRSRISNESNEQSRGLNTEDPDSGLNTDGDASCNIDSELRRVPSAGSADSTGHSATAAAGHGCNPARARLQRCRVAAAR